MRDDDRERLIDFLRRKVCGPCRRGEPDQAHEGCVEAHKLIAIVGREWGA